MAGFNSKSAAVAATFAVLLPLLVLLLAEPHRVVCTTEAGGVVDGNEVWTQQKSPYVARYDVLVLPGGELTVEPGVEVRFAPGVGITVRGVFRAQGLPEKRVVLTSEKGQSDKRFPPSSSPPDVRLVDGPSVREGRLQLWYRNKWRSVCTGGYNWTQAEFRVLCRQLGFTDGELYKWLEPTNQTARIFYAKPDCRGGEKDVFACNRPGIKMGNGACDHYLDLGVRCSAHLSDANVSNWRGIWFDNARSVPSGPSDGVVRKFYRSESSLDYVDVVNAGYNRTGGVTSALEITHVPPRLNNVTVRWSLDNGINASALTSDFELSSSVVAFNRGHGLFVNSSEGQVRVLDSHFNANGGSGIHVTRFLPDSLPADATDFCASPHLGREQPYPADYYFRVTGKAQKTDCHRVFFAPPGKVFTVHFRCMQSSTDDGGTVAVTNGERSTDPVLVSFGVRNSSVVPSVVSTGGSVWVAVKAQPNATLTVCIRLDASDGKVPDVNVTNSVSEHNGGTGLLAENTRSMVHVLQSRMAGNHHVGGIHVRDGASDVNVTTTVVRDNVGDGVNVSSYGGRTNISDSDIHNNTGHGIAVWINKTAELVVAPQTTTVMRSTVDGNGKTGLQVGPHWVRPSINITMNKFTNGSGAAVVVDMRREPDGGDSATSLLIANNIFAENAHVSLSVFLAGHSKTFVEHNLFKNNFGECLFFRTETNVTSHVLPTAVAVQDNKFYRNRGTFVASLGLPFSSPSHTLTFTRNVLKDNVVREAFPSLNPRNRVAAVVVVNSPSILVYRNLFSNPDSKYDIGSRALGRYDRINGSWNYLGGREINAVYDRVFDCRARYNLACVDVQPYLLQETDVNSELKSLDDEVYVPKFKVEGPDEIEIGGEILGEVTLTDGVYRVTRDIYVKPSSVLQVTDNVVFQFEPSTGLMVQGRIHSEGIGDVGNKRVLFTYSALRTNGTDDDDATSVRPLGQRPDKPFISEGLVQVKVKEQWGTVCRYGWSIEDAALVCHQLGLVLNPLDWEVKSGAASETHQLKMLMSNIRCGVLDTDIVRCDHEGYDDLENVCDRSDEVYARCYEPTWSGIRLGVMAEGSFLKYTQIEKAGLFDYSTRSFQAALQVDFYHHTLDNIIVTDNVFHGVEILNADVYQDLNQLSIRNGRIMRNQGHGIVLHSCGIRVETCNVSDNQLSGVFYEPRLSRASGTDVSKWFGDRDGKRVQLIRMDGKGTRRDVRRGANFLVTTEVETPTQGEAVQLVFRTSRDNSFGVHVLNPIWPDSTEEIEISDGVDRYARKWTLDRDLFPILTQRSSDLSIRLTPGARPRGGALIYVAVVEKRSQEAEASTHILRIAQSRLERNEHGVRSVYYNGHITGDWWNKWSANQSVQVAKSYLTNNTLCAVSVETLSINTAAVRAASVGNTSFVVDEVVMEHNSQGMVQWVDDDALDSSHVFHWVVLRNQCSFNRGSCFNVTLPYLRNRDLHSSHTVHLRANIVDKNHGSAISVGGHFARVVVADNIVVENESPFAVFAIRGTEKEMWLQGNNIERNSGRCIVDFSTHGHSGFGNLVALFQNNRVQGNAYTVRAAHVGESDDYEFDNYVVGVRGIQRVNVTNNLLGRNRFGYEFLSDIRSSSLGNIVDGRENWWGSSDYEVIRQLIYDGHKSFSTAAVEFVPFLVEESLSAPVSPTSFPVKIDYGNLGGRISGDVHLPKRPRAYEVKTDLTIMPGSVLTVDPGVVVYFHSGVGILVLGSMVARGTYDERIKLLPHESLLNQYAESVEVSGAPNVRLCSGGTCESTTEGFVEIFNETTKQWVPVCEDSFTENNARVVCGAWRRVRNPSVDVFVRSGPRYDVRQAELNRVHTWTLPRQCSGREKSLEGCRVRTPVSRACSTESHYTFVHCSRPGKGGHWGGITFSTADYEGARLSQDGIGEGANEVTPPQESVLEYIDIEGAGFLHHRRSSAILAVYKMPVVSHVRVSGSASHGITVISPATDVMIKDSRFVNNSGVGVNVLSMRGDMRDSDVNKLVPLTEAHIPHELFGMVDICNSEKFIRVRDRLLLYYKYGDRSATCSKVFESYDQVGIRFLYVNLHRGSEALRAAVDSVRVFDGDVSSVVSAVPLAEVTGNASNVTQMHKSSGSFLSVQILASGASEYHGFIADVYAIPPVVNNYDDDVSHNITRCVFQNNSHGAISYSAVGEVSPPLVVERNVFQRNGVGMSHNFSSADAAVKVDVQNSRTVIFQNNALYENQGGLFLRSGSESRPTALHGAVSNNVFVRNHNHPAVSVVARDVIPHQEVAVSHNVISFNPAPYERVIVFDKVVVKATHNYIYNNTGQHALMTRFDPDQNQRVFLQTFSENVFLNNTATVRDYRASVWAASSGQSFHRNVFLNPANDFELAAVGGVGGVINASSNWWGYNFSVAISGRIRDKDDDVGETQVIYSPFLQSDESVREAHCPFGWRNIGSSCYLYFGGVVDAHRAADVCEIHNASVAYASTRRQLELQDYVKHAQSPRYDAGVPVRVKTVGLFRGDGCSALVDGTAESVSCDDTYAFLCEWGEPDLEAEREMMMAFVIGLATGVVVLLLCVCVVFCGCRCRYRRQAKKVQIPKHPPPTKSTSSTVSEELSYVPFVRTMESLPTPPSSTTLMPPATDCITFRSREDLSDKKVPPSSDDDDDSDASEESSFDDDKKSLPGYQEKLPLMEVITINPSITQTAGGKRLPPPRRYLETSLDELDATERYLETDA